MIHILVVYLIYIDMLTAWDGCLNRLTICTECISSWWIGTLCIIIMIVGIRSAIRPGPRHTYMDQHSFNIKPSAKIFGFVCGIIIQCFCVEIEAPTLYRKKSTLKSSGHPSAGVTLPVDWLLFPTLVPTSPSSIFVSNHSGNRMSIPFVLPLPLSPTTGILAIDLGTLDLFRILISRSVVLDTFLFFSKSITYLLITYEIELHNIHESRY